MSKIGTLFIGVVLALGPSSCATYQPDYSGSTYIAYETSAVGGPVTKTNFRIAILPFVDNSSALELGSAAAKQENEYYQFSTLMPWVLAEELRYNKVSPVVHIAPALVDDYDLVIKGEWLVSETKDGSAGTTMKARFSVFTPNAGESLFDKSYKATHEKKQWVNIRLAEKVSFLKQSAHRFIADSQPVMSSLAAKQNDKSRRFAYYQHLDPDIKTLSSAMSKSRRSGNRQAASQLFGEYKHRLSYLEAYRAREWEVLARQNSYKEDAYRERLHEIGRYVKEKNRLQAEVAKQQAAYNAARKKQTNAALAAILMAAQGASKAGVSNADVLSSALSEMGQALQNLPPPAPPVDDSMLDQQIDLSGLHDFNTDTFGKLEGKSLSDIRRSFLSLYQQKTHDLSRYY